METITKLVSENLVVIFSKKTCISHAIKSLFCEFGVNPIIYELDEIPNYQDIEQAIQQLGCDPTVAVHVFIRGELVGGANEIMSLHLKGDLKPMLYTAATLSA